jgi:hypothetical protein
MEALWRRSTSGYSDGAGGSGIGRADEWSTALSTALQMRSGPLAAAPPTSW